MSFGIEEAIKAADRLVFHQVNRHLTDVEISVLRGAWEKLEYDQIAAQNKYATSYISQDAAPKLWKLLGRGLGEKVRKSNFREALKRSWEKHNTVLAHSSVISSKITDIVEDSSKEGFFENHFDGITDRTQVAGDLSRGSMHSQHDRLDSSHQPREHLYRAPARRADVLRGAQSARRTHSD